MYKIHVFIEDQEVGKFIDESSIFALFVFIDYTLQAIKHCKAAQTCPSILVDKSDKRINVFPLDRFDKLIY